MNHDKCDWCKKPYSYKGKGRWRRFCSVECARKHITKMYNRRKNASMKQIMENNGTTRIDHIDDFKREIQQKGFIKPLWRI